MVASAEAAAPRQEQSSSGTLGELLSEAARRYARNPALVIKPGVRTRIVTYTELERLSLRAGRYLPERGVQKGDRVVVWAPNMPEWVELFFGCMKIGAVLVPIDVRSAPDFVAAVVRQTEPKLAVLSRATAKLAEGLDVPSFHLEELEAELARAADPVGGPGNELAVGPDDLAEIVFTSGTTGDPKGVMLSHRNIVSNVRSANEVLPIKPGFRLLSLLPLSHMFEQSVGLLAALSGGARVVYPVSRQPSVLFRTMAENRITMLCLVPQALRLFWNAIEREARRQGREATFARLLPLAEWLPMKLRRVLFRSVHARMGGSLDLAISGGAYLDPALAHRWELLGVSVLQGYGATEASPIIACDHPGQRKPDAVGRAYPGVDVRIDVDGEILARGPNIFQGYWRNPQATAAVLDDGCYRTGDLGSLDGEGYLHLKGRKKDLIVLANGQNVYPEDIENELARHPAVAEGVVVGLDRGEGSIEVHAALLMRDADHAAEAVRETNDRLADHQRIQGYTVWPLDDFPRTHTLKVKKGEVLDYLKGRRDGHTAAVEPPPPETPSENPLVGLISELASVPASQIQPETTLGEDLGLDSLGRVELLSAVESELGTYVDESLISPETTVAELERLVTASQARAAGIKFCAWPLHPLAAVGRELFLQLVVFPLYHLFWRVRVIGQQRLRGLDQPVMIAANHHFGSATFGFDPAAVWMALPRELRRRTCTAGEEHAVFDRPLRGWFARLTNAFPLSQSGNVRGSLEYIGRLLDLGWSILIFPEGRLTLGGPLQPFLGGTGMVAVEGRTPVVPVWIEVEQESVLQSPRSPWRGAFTVHIGGPLTFAPGTPYGEATARIEAAVGALRDIARASIDADGKRPL